MSVTAAVGVGLCHVERLATLSQFIKVLILGDFHNDLAKTAKEVGSHLERNPMARWRIGDEDMVEWSERKGDCCEPIVSLDVIGWVLTLAARWYGLGGRGIGIVGRVLRDFLELYIKCSPILHLWSNTSLCSALFCNLIY